MRGSPVHPTLAGVDTVGVASPVLPPLLRFQKKFVKALDSGRYNRLVLSVPRGNGKSWLCARLAVRTLTPGDPLHVPGHETVLCAQSLEQARIIHKMARRILDGDPDYRFLDSMQRIGITHVPTGTKIRAIGSNGSTAMGLGSDTMLAVCDEPGSWESIGGQLMSDAIDTSLGKVGASMKCVYIGTLAPAKGIWWPELVEAGTGGKTYVQALEGDPEKWDDWPEVRRVNPVTRLKEAVEFRAELKEEIEKATRDGRLKARFLSYRMNVPSSDPATKLLTVDDWKHAVARPTPPREGYPIVGVDLGMNRAWSAAVAIWRNGRVEATALAPGTPSLEDQERRDCVNAGVYQRLFDAGKLTIDEGRNVPRVSVLCERIAEWEPEVIFADRARAGELADEAPCEVVSRVTRWFGAAEDIRALRKQVLDGPLAIDAASLPLLSTSVACTTVKGDDQGNTRIIKSRNNRARDDVAQALTLAAGALSRAPDNDAPSHVVC